MGFPCHDAGMGKAQDPGLGSRAGNPQDVEVTGDLPMPLTASW